MCIFSRAVSSVANTKIFARSSTGGKQFLVYSMQYQADSELAMILPLPTLASPSEDAVRFIDLSAYPEFFGDMSNGFEWELTRGQPLQVAYSATPTLKVHEVGSFDASFVPHQRDFARLDSRFRLPDHTWKQMPQYRDYSFAVFKLQAGAKNIHPMAFEFPRRNSQELFFPTVHVHEGIVGSHADFDHSLYFQRHVAEDSSTETYNESSSPAGKFMDVARTQGIVDADILVQLKPINGMSINRDFFINENV